MDKETLSNYGWIVICVLVLAVMLALATPFGTFVADGFKATYTGLFQTGDNAMDTALSAVGVSNKLPCGHGRKEAGDHSQKECGHYNCQDADCGCVPASCGVEGHWSGDGKDHTRVYNHDGHSFACQCNSWIVPKGGTYTIYATSVVYNEGEQLPCGYRSNRTNDTFQFGDYIYTAVSNDDGWNVSGVLDTTKATYGTILENINNLVVNKMNRTFKDCTALEVAPIIPNSITQMPFTFEGCTSLTTAPIIPKGVTNLYGTFEGCTALKTYAGSTNPDGDFSGYIIPSSVRDMKSTFYKCLSLSGEISIPCSLNVYSYTNCPATITHYHVNGCDGSCGK